MLINHFYAIVQALGLSQGLFKPCPAYLNSSSSQSAINPTSSSKSPFFQADQSVNLAQWSSDYSDMQDGCYVEPYDPPDIWNLTFPPFDQARANVFRYRQQQAVNIGSWFVHEQWMTPSLFSCASGSRISELDIASGWGSTESARALLERHWDTFVNQSDFNYLASVGINTVRLPIGYWSLGPAFMVDTPFAAVSDVYRNAWSRIIRAINMADAAGIGVLVDLHGAVGSQNGQPHSGISDGAVNLFNNPLNIDKTLAVLTFLMQQLGYVTNVVGIQILNEPQNVPELPDFYSKAITTMRQASSAGPSFPLYMHNGFDLVGFSQYIANRTDFVVQDHHSYFVFTPSDEAEPAHQHTIDVEYSISESLKAASEETRRNLVVDEWSCALTAESLSSEPDPEGARRDFCTGQMEVYTNQTAGWSFWAYKKEGCIDDPGWCFTAAVGNSLPTSFFSYGQGGMNDTSQLQQLADVVGEMNSPFDRPSYTQRRQYSRIHGSNPRTRRDAAAMPAAAKGYSDGFMTAKIFATYGMSRLGFSGQYMESSIQSLGSEVVDDSRVEDYKNSFINGLRDGEAVLFSLARSTVNLIHNLLFNPSYFWLLASLVIVSDALLTQLIIHYVSFTEIDWETYMIQTQLFVKGQLDYSKITGPTGPVVYPAGHLYIHQILYDITDAGKNIFLSQQIYAALYILSLLLTCAIYRRAGDVPNWIVLLLPLSKRLHSIYVLRLFNDCWMAVMMYASVLAYQISGWEHLGTLFLCLALSIKMSALLYLPGILVVLFKRKGLISTVLHLIALVVGQASIAWPFIRSYPSEYLHSSFDFSRVFLYKWTVNWRLVSEETFLSSPWAKGLLVAHIVSLIIFGLTRWCSGVDNVLALLRRGFRRPTQPAGIEVVSSNYVVTTLFTSNLIGILFARSLHYQFYSWYAQQIPFLALTTQYSLPIKLIIMVAIEYAWNVFPSTVLSSSTLLVANSLLLAGVWTGLGFPGKVAQRKR